MSKERDRGLLGFKFFPDGIVDDGTDCGDIVSEESTCDESDETEEQFFCVRDGMNIAIADCGHCNDDVVKTVEVFNLIDGIFKIV